jgi:hypothetical protein
MANVAYRLEDQKVLETLIDDFWNNRVDFVKHVIGVEPSHQQKQALNALDKTDSVSIASGHGCGKSAVECWAILHFMMTRPFARIGCTAPSKPQLYQILWSELAKWHRLMQKTTAGRIFASQYEWTKETFRNIHHPEEWFAMARTATRDNPEALQGLHGDYVMLIMDEASGVVDAVYEAVEGSHGFHETKMLLCGNPTRLDGTFYKSHNDAAFKKSFTRLKWNCLDSLKSKGGLVPDKYVERIKAKYGSDSNMYRVRVLGKFPLRDGDSFIPFDLVDSARLREVPKQENPLKVFGVDVARFGDDDTVIAIRDGDEFKPFHVLKQKETMEVAGFVAQLANKEKPKHIFVDVIGIGAGVYDRLEEMGFPVVAVNVSEAPALDPKLYKRLRDELWGNMRDWLEVRRGRLWDNSDDDLLGELTTPRYKFTSDGKILIESKDDMRKRGLKSPNIADAHLLTFAMPHSNYTHGDDDIFEFEETMVLDPDTGY